MSGIEVPVGSEGLGRVSWVRHLVLIALGWGTVIGGLGTGCAQTTATVEINSVPQYAEVYRKDGTHVGTCPVRLHYSLNDADRKRGFIWPEDLVIRWVSGAQTVLKDWKVRILGSNTIDVVTVERPKGAPGAKQDFEHAIAVEKEREAEAKRRAEEAARQRAEEESRQSAESNQDSDSSDSSDEESSEDSSANTDDSESDASDSDAETNEQVNWAGVRAVEQACDRALVSSSDGEECLVAVKSAPFNPTRAILACDRALVSQSDILGCIRHVGRALVEPSSTIRACDRAFVSQDSILGCVSAIRNTPFSLSRAVAACDQEFVSQDDMLECVKAAGRAQSEPTNVIKACGRRFVGSSDKLRCIERLTR